MKKVSALILSLLFIMSSITSFNAISLVDEFTYVDPLEVDDQVKYDLRKYYQDTTGMESQTLNDIKATQEVIQYKEDNIPYYYLFYPTKFSTPNIIDKPIYRLIGPSKLYYEKSYTTDLLFDTGMCVYVGNPYTTEFDETNKFASLDYVLKNIPKSIEKLENFYGTDNVGKVLNVEPDSINLYEDLFKETYKIEELAFYNEFSVENSNLVVIRAEENIDDNNEYSYAYIDDIVIFGVDKGAKPFKTQYGVYNTSTNEFVDLVDAVENDYYPELKEQIISMGIAKRIGDIDNDQNVNILDASKIQKCLAKINTYPAFDEIQTNLVGVQEENIKYISDFNLDKSRDIMDATAIQKTLAGIKIK